ncbi:MAG: ATP-binding cassette domain-containing protein [Streptococcaceae bacterium]|jgi:ABC-type lipoprotein export system ATPase subunit/ABC-type antimicrobial peptide transport system permease subunit|nr:ATP-binding cassette domain-containing protein [Streptococcaceae bacterium]
MTQLSFVFENATPALFLRQEILALGLIAVGIFLMLFAIRSLKRAKKEADSADFTSLDTSVLQLRDIHKSYFLGKEEFPVLHGIDISFERGDFVSLLGESGGGKSTLMNIIGGLDREYTGDVIVDGIVQRTKKERDMDAYRRDTIGFIFQSFNLVSYLSVLDNIMIALKMTTLSEKERKARAITLTKQVGLYEHRKKKPAQLSGGQKQRVAIARALASDPEIILADEPTGALDSQNTREVLSILQDIAKSGKTVIVVTHSQEVANAGTRIIYLTDGKINEDERLKPMFEIAEREKPFATKALSYVDIVRTGFKHFVNKWKINLLIALGTAIGLFAVIFFLGLGIGGTKYMNSTIEGLFPVNTNTPGVVSRPTTKESDRVSEGQLFSQGQQAAVQRQSFLTQAEIDKLSALDHVTKVEKLHLLMGQGTLSADSKSTKISGLSTWTNYNVASSLTKGSAPKNDDEIVVQKSLAKKLNADYNSLIGKKVSFTLTVMGDDGKPLTINATFKISGILEDSGQLQDTYVTSSALTNILSAHNMKMDAQMAIVTVDKVSNVKEVTKKIQQTKIDGKQVFASENLGTLLDTITNITSIVSYVLAAIAGVGLIVSMFMIIVTTYMSVAERTKEIGIIRALGGRKKDISRLFTAESSMLGLFSATLALGVSFALAAVVNHALADFLGGIDIIQITPGIMIFAVVISLVIALLASLAPSRRAAKMNTIEALATE